VDNGDVTVRFFFSSVSIFSEGEAVVEKNYFMNFNSFGLSLNWLLTELLRTENTFVLTQLILDTNTGVNRLRHF